MIKYKEFRIGGTMIKYMHFRCSHVGRRNKYAIQIDSRDIPCTCQFLYLGSIIHEDGNVEEDVIYMIIVGWLKWRSASRILCDR